MRDSDRWQTAHKILHSNFQLTPSQARVAYRIARGEALANIAAAHGVAVSTVKTHLQAVFIKTGTHRQAELTALLARMHRAFR
jgi:DNA-binding CsgD family transcriptional regulator